MKRKSIALLTALLLLLSLVPIGLVSAAQGTVALKGQFTGDSALADKTKYSAESTGGYNVGVLEVADTDLDVSQALVATTSGVITFDSKPFELLATGTGSLKQFTAGNTPIADTSGDNAVNFADIDIRVLQSGAGLTVTSATPATGVIDVLTAPAIGATSRFNVTGVVADAGYAATASAITAPTSATKFKVTITRTTDGDAGLSVKVGCLSTDRVSGVQQNTTYTLAFAHGDTDPASGSITKFCTAFANTMSSTGTTVSTGGTIAVWLDFTDGNTAGGDAFTATIEETNTVAANYKYESYNNTDTVTTTATTKVLSVNSGTNPTGIKLTGTETGTGTGKFQGHVAFISANDLNNINACISAKSRTTASVAISQLVTDLGDTATAACNSATLATWVGETTLNLKKGTTAGLVALTTSDFIDELLNRTLTVAHGDTVTATYSDASTSATAATDTATLDLVKPTISGATPADDAATNDTTPLLTATATDADAGIAVADISVYQSTAAAGAAALVSAALVSKDPITNGFTVSFISGTLPEGAHIWELEVTDKVGNMATTGSRTVTADRINFTIDGTKPTFVSAATGTGIKLDAADVDADGKTDDYVEFANSGWIKLTFSEVLDSASVSAGDLNIDTGAATSVLVQKNVSTAAGAAVASAESIAYVEVATLAANAKPKIKLISAVSDKAGNASTIDTATTVVTQKTAADAIKPTLTASTSPALGKEKDKITITVTSDEALSGTPTVVVTKAVGTTVTVGVTETATNTWAGTYTVANADIGQYTATASGNDKAAVPNAGTKDVLFEADDVAPTITHTITTDQKLELDAVLFLPVKADDGVETYTAGTDGHKKTAISAAKLETLSKKAGTVTATTALTAADFQSTDNINYIYGAADLAKGFYKLTVSAKDDAGNERKDISVAFEVIDRTATSVALSPGWNLISLPKAAIDSSIETILADPTTGVAMTTITQVYSLQGSQWLTATWNATASTWSGDLTQMKDGHAYFVRSTSFDPIKYMSKAFDAVAAQPSYALKAGWNGIGITTSEAGAVVTDYLSSVTWKTLRSYDQTNQYETMSSTGGFSSNWTLESATAVNLDLDGDGNKTDPIVVAGQGYFVYVPADATLAP